MSDNSTKDLDLKGFFQNSSNRIGAGQFARALQQMRESTGLIITSGGRIVCIDEGGEYSVEGHEKPLSKGELAWVETQIEKGLSALPIPFKFSDKTAITLHGAAEEIAGELESMSEKLRADHITDTFEAKAAVPETGYPGSDFTRPAQHATAHPSDSDNSPHQEPA